MGNSIGQQVFKYSNKSSDATAFHGAPDHLPVFFFISGDIMISFRSFMLGNLIGHISE